MTSKAKASAKKAKPANGGAYRASTVYKAAKKVSARDVPEEFTRVDIEFIGIDHSGASYEARVYVNNPSADASTGRGEGSGYAGSYHIFGHGGCFGDLGHCDIPKKKDVFDPRPSHPLEPIKKVVIATKAFKRAVAQGGDITITVVPIIRCWTEDTGMGDVMKFDHINVVMYGS